jgi:hypothetical protein
MPEELEVELWSDQSGPMFRLKPVSQVPWTESLFEGASLQKGIISTVYRSLLIIRRHSVRYLPATTRCIPRNCFTTGGNYIWEGSRKMLLNSKLP